MRSSAASRITDGRVGIRRITHPRASSFVKKEYLAPVREAAELAVLCFADECLYDKLHLVRKLRDEGLGFSAKAMMEAKSVQDPEPFAHPVQTLQKIG